MRYLQVSKRTLTNNGFSYPAQANSFFPAGNQTDHLHLGTPTSYYDGPTFKAAEDGNVFVTYISVKRNNNFFFRFDHDDQDGYFSFPAGRSAADLTQGQVTALRALGIVRGL